MTEREAWYILRAEIVMSWEGQGVPAHSTEPGDDEVLTEALRLAGHRLDPYDRWAFPELKETEE